MSEDEIEYNLESQIRKNKELQAQYDALHSKYNSLEANYETMIKRLSAIEAQTQIAPTATAQSSSLSTSDKNILATDTSVPAKSFIEEISAMKGDAMNASASISELQQVWSHVDSKLQEFSYRINEIDQYMRKNSLFIKGLKDIPKKTYGLKFSIYIIEKLKELLPTIADSLRVEEIDVSHPLPTRGKSTSCVIVKFVRRDIRNLVFYEKRELKNHPLKISITEHLTSQNLWYIEEARKLVGFKNAWSSQCIVYALVNGQKIAIKSPKDLDYVRNVTSTHVTPASHVHHSARDSVIEAVKNINNTNSNSIVNEPSIEVSNVN